MKSWGFSKVLKKVCGAKERWHGFCPKEDLNRTGLTRALGTEQFLKLQSANQIRSFCVRTCHAEPVVIHLGVFPATLPIASTFRSFVTFASSGFRNVLTTIRPPLIVRFPPGALAPGGFGQSLVSLRTNIVPPVSTSAPGSGLHEINLRVGIDNAIQQSTHAEVN